MVIEIFKSCLSKKEEWEEAIQELKKKLNRKDFEDTKTLGKQLMFSGGYLMGCGYDMSEPVELVAQVHTALERREFDRAVNIVEKLEREELKEVLRPEAPKPEFLQFWQPVVPKEELERLYIAEDLTKREIAEKFRLPPSIIQEHLRRFGLTK